MSTKAHSPEFERKARNKKQDPKKFEERALSKEKKLKQPSQRRLENQINDLPKFDDVFHLPIEELRHFTEKYGLNDCVLLHWNTIHITFTPYLFIK